MDAEERRKLDEERRALREQQKALREEIDRMTKEANDTAERLKKLNKENEEAEAEKTRLTLYLSAVFQEQGLRKINKKDRELIIASIVNNRGRLSNGLEEKLLKRNVCTEEQIDILRSSLTEGEQPDTDPEMFTER